LLIAYSCKQQDRSGSLTAKACLEEAETALANDSIRLGETLLRKAIRLAEASEDWHTNYIAYQRLAEALSQGNPEEALNLMKKALTVYDQHPDDERNRVILLDYAGTYAAQVAYINEGAYDEALDFVHRAYDIAKKSQMTDLECQTLTSLANIAWAKEDYRQALDYAHQAEAIIPPSDSSPLRGERGGSPPSEGLGEAPLRPGTLQVLASR
jgi:tetratricopeptide (TPR) repeat protein